VAPTGAESAVYDCFVSVVARSVCVSVSSGSCAETAEPIKMVVCAVDSWGSQRTVYLVAAGSRPEQRDILSVIAYSNILAVDILNLIR